MAVAGPGDEILVSRNAHKSVVSAFLLSGSRPVWVHPKWDAERDLAHPPEPDDVRTALDEHPDVKGMLLISPTDWGSAADVEGVAKVCHQHCVPLLLDEAWGAHLPFHDDLPPCGMQAGADLAVVSVHKLGTAVEQSSVFHMQGDRIDPTVLGQRSDLLTTTSPSTLVYASLDGWRRQMVEHGEELIGVAMQRADRLRDALRELDGIELLADSAIGPDGAFAIDPLKLTMDVSALGVTGYAATEWIRTNLHVNLSACDVRRVQAQISLGDDDRTEEVLLRAMRTFVERAGEVDRAPEVALPKPGDLELEIVLLPRDAFFGPAEMVPADQAAGRIAAELITPYPPGVPAVCPGERITQEVVDYLRTGVDAGMVIPEAADPEVKHIRVVA
jgi:arginine/lysine/ornithine decarboxylase